MAVNLQTLTFPCRQEALDCDAINCTLDLLVQKSANDFEALKIDQTIVPSCVLEPTVAFFTAIPSEVVAPPCHAKLYVVGTTTDEIGGVTAPKKP